MIAKSGDKTGSHIRYLEIIQNKVVSILKFGRNSPDLNKLFNNQWILKFKDSVTLNNYNQTKKTFLMPLKTTSAKRKTNTTRRQELLKLLKDKSY